MFRRYCLPWLVLAVYRVWSSTWRTTIVESDGCRALREAGEPMVFAHWHRDELAMLKHVRALKIATMTSLSKDGQLIDYVIRKLGGATAKGSSNRGGVGALLGLVRLVGAGYRASIAVDGPRGPIFKAKPGVFELSKLTGATITPVGLASQSRFIFARSWNQARLPKPFTRVVLVFGDPIALDATAKPNLKCPELAERLNAKITAACVSAEEYGLKLLGSRTAKAGGFAVEAG